MCPSLKKLAPYRLLAFQDMHSRWSDPKMWAFPVKTALPVFYCRLKSEFARLRLKGKFGF